MDLVIVRRTLTFLFLGVLLGSGLCLGQCDVQFLGHCLAEFLNIFLVELVRIRFEFLVVAEVFESFEVHASQVFWGYFVILFFVLIVVFIFVIRIIVILIFLGILVVIVRVFFVLLIFIFIVRILRFPAENFLGIFCRNGSQECIGAVIVFDENYPVRKNLTFYLFCCSFFFAIIKLIKGV